MILLKDCKIIRVKTCVNSIRKKNNCNKKSINSMSKLSKSKTKNSLLSTRFKASKKSLELPTLKTALMHLNHTKSLLNLKKN